MIVRRAEQRDLPQIVQIEGLCFPEETAFPPGMFRVLGFIMGYISGRGGAVYTLDVHPRYRRKGIGSRLIRALEEELQALGANAVRLEAAQENLQAVNLYRKAGYRERELVRNYYGRGRDAVRMWKHLL
jgi:ribosomal-protein-alanine N-acetyltransferase